MTEKVDIILARIKSLREAKGFTYAHMLTDVSVKNPDAYFKIENNRRISVLRLLEISKALEVDAGIWFEDLDKDKHIIKEEQEKYGKDSVKDLNDIYLLIHELKREILLLKKEIAGMKTPAVKKRKSSKIN